MRRVRARVLLIVSAVLTGLLAYGGLRAAWDTCPGLHCAESYEALGFAALVVVPMAWVLLRLWGRYW